MFKELLKEYIKNNLEHPLQTSCFEIEKKAVEAKPKKAKIGVSYRSIISYEESELSLDDYLEKEQDESKFQKLLFKYIDSKDLKDSDVYNKAGIDRRLFSKIRSKENYHPSKETVILLSLALELNEDEMLSLLNSASYYLPKNNVYDLIIRFCFINKIYDVKEVNNLLYEYNCKTLS